MKLCHIVAQAEDGTIGNNGSMPWRLPKELSNFKRLTLGYPVIMGRKTFESIPHTLSGRRSLVVSKNSEFSSVEAALLSCVRDKVVFIIGGKSIYEQTIDQVDVVFRTKVHACFPGSDTVLDPGFYDKFQVVSWESNGYMSDHSHSFTFEILV